MKKLIKNYTTEIPTYKTVSEIQQILGTNGASGIAFDYDGSGKRWITRKIDIEVVDE